MYIVLGVSVAVSCLAVFVLVTCVRRRFEPFLMLTPQLIFGTATAFIYTGSGQIQIKRNDQIFPMDSFFYDYTADSIMIALNNFCLAQYLWVFGI